MVHRFASFRDYKSTDIGWLGVIPSNWAEKPLKHISIVDNSGCYGEDPEGFELTASVATTAQINTEGKFDLAAMPIRGFREEEFDRYSCNTGQILVVKSSGSATNIISGKAGLVTQNEEGFVFSNFLLRITPDLNTVVPKFLYALLISSLTRERIKQMCSTTTYPNLSVPEYSSALLPIPPLDEQATIVSFLDHETAKIDTLIDKQQQLIKLLKEKRQAVISHAVTKGLNPDAVMKDSGVEWLSEVPEHWVVKRLGVLFSESSARANTEAELEYPILSVSIHHGISDKELDESELDRKVSRSEDKSLYKIVKDNDLAYNMMRAWQGGFGASKLNGLISPAYVVCKPETKINSSYYELVLRSPNAVTELKRFSRGITDFRLRLYWDEFKSICVPVPPETEIDQILGHVSRVNSKYDHLADVAQRQIDLLQERRTALISAAVTGKIDVRNWQPAQAETIREASA